MLIVAKRFDSEKHSAFSTSYPIYLFEQRTEEVPDPSYIPPPTEGSATETTSATTPDSTDSASKNEDDDEKIVVEDVEDDEGVTKKEDDKPQIPTISVTTDHWVHLNDQPPLWTRSVKCNLACLHLRLTSLTL